MSSSKSKAAANPAANEKIIGLCFEGAVKYKDKLHTPQDKGQFDRFLSERMDEIKGIVKGTEHKDNGRDTGISADGGSTSDTNGE